ncbi:MAG TPA: hypothetical protein VMD04_01375 [Candidatus Margulisiibacteriota bacterium]|nr:hypothetical protein [Candidatus Margulisiibacteriota bacterium]
MKKITVSLLILFLIYGMAILNSAQAAQATSAKKSGMSAEVVRGKIISIDTAKNEIVVKENKTGTEKTIAVDPKVISSLKAGEEVKARLKEGTNSAESIKQVVKKTASTKK